MFSSITNSFVCLSYARHSANLITPFNTHKIYGGRTYYSPNITDKKLHNLPKVKQLEIGKISNCGDMPF